MSRWYYAVNGEAVGPVSKENIVEMLKSGRIGVMDFIFLEGSDDWKPLQDWPEFSKEETVTKSLASVESWMVHIERGSQIEKKGPFSADQIFQLLESKELNLDDYIWKEGMSEWYQIRKVKPFSEFSEGESGDNETVSIAREGEIYEKSAVDLLKNIKVKDQEQLDEISRTISVVENRATEKESGEASFVSSSVDSYPEELNSGSIENDKVDEGPLLKEEIRKRKEELDAMMKKLFGEDVFENDSETKIDKKLAAEVSVKQMADQLPITRILKEKGYIQEPNDKQEDSPDDSKENKREADDKIKSKIAKVVSENQSLNETTNSGFGDKVLLELSALFPRGSLLRFFSIFFLLFAFTIILVLSSQNKREDVESSDSSVKNRMKMTDGNQKEQKLSKSKSKSIEKKKKQVSASVQKESPSSGLPTFLTLKTLKKGLDLYLVILTDAGKKMPVNVHMEAGIKDVIGNGAYYYDFDFAAIPELNLNLNSLQVPLGKIKTKVTVGDISRSLTIRNYESYGKFQEEKKRHKKMIAVWHQKEKRALYGSVSKLKDFGMQLMSLLPLQKQSSQRWLRAYRNWKGKVIASRSGYLKGISIRVKNQYVYPKLWLEVKSLENVLLAIDEENPGFSYTGFKEDLNKIDQKVKKLSLW